MCERIYYDEYPADTAALGWLDTKVGIAITKQAVDNPREALRRAFRTGYLIREKAGEAARKERE